ncbi:unnamed protein product [Vicia faba]|uniref:Uncharacterized protein n=1 Tax=Vicia faba TaxID=3906 RepID=A0AAV0YU86_VICFA|nr:unnamed protein product [Vicia faba]
MVRVDVPLDSTGYSDFIARVFPHIEFGYVFTEFDLFSPNRVALIVAISFSSKTFLGENKKKNVGGKGRNGKVLEDIGNLMINPVDPHSNKPKRITRNQLASIAQAAEKNKILVAEAVNENFVVDKLTISITMLEIGNGLEVTMLKKDGALFFKSNTD